MSKPNWVELNKEVALQANAGGHPLVLGCNYHVTWQSHKAMRFVLVRVNDNRAYMSTRNTRKSFWTNINDLIFIATNANKIKAELYRPEIAKLIRKQKKPRT